MIPINDVMTTNVISVQPDLPIFDAIQLLLKNKISGLPVVDADNVLQGILSEKDVLSILVKGNYTSSQKVSDYMSRKVVSFKEDADAIEIAKYFINNHIRRVPIVCDNKLVGVVSRRDLIELIVDARNRMSNERMH